jgi:hypothetical protein
MGINPAGLGMYRSNEVTISPMMGFVRADNSADNWQENSLSRFSMANLGVVFNVYEGSGALVSINMAIGYNRVADLNYNYSYTSLSAPSAMPYRSINDAFVRQLGQGGVFPDAEGMLNYDYGDAYYWGGMMAYNGYGMRTKQDRASYAKGETICGSMYGEYSNCIAEGNLYYKGQGSLYTAYVATYDQPRGWMAKGNTYVCNSSFMRIGYIYETLNHIDHRMWKRARVDFPFNYETLVWYTGLGVDPKGVYYHYDEVSDAEDKQCFFMTGYYVENGGFNK